MKQEIRISRSKYADGHWERLFVKKGQRVKDSRCTKNEVIHKRFFW